MGIRKEELSGLKIPLSTSRDMVMSRWHESEMADMRLRIPSHVYRSGDVNSHASETQILHCITALEELDRNCEYDTVSK